MLPRGWLIKACIAAALLLTAFAIAAFATGGDTGVQLALVALVVCMGAGLAIPFAPRQWGQSSTALSRFATYVIAVCYCNWLATAAIGMSTTGQLLYALSLVMFAVGPLCFLVALPALLIRRRGGATRTPAQGIAIWGAAAIAALTECVGLVLVALPAGGTPWTSELFLWLLGLSLMCLAGTLLVAMVAIRPRPVSSERGSPTMETVSLRFSRVGRAMCMAFAALATLLLAIPWTTQWINQRFYFDGAGALLEFYPLAYLFLALPVGLATWNVVGLAPMGRISSTLRLLASVSVTIHAVVGAVAALPASYGADLSNYAPMSFILLLLGIAFGIASAGTGWLGSDSDERRAMVDTLSWRCPRCSGWFAVTPGVETGCSRCGLAVLVCVRDDRCPQCSYDLRGFGNEAAACPECGRVRQVMAVGTEPRLAATTPGGEHGAQVGAVHPPIAGEIGG
jgi:hypothetical protein